MDQPRPRRAEQSTRTARVARLAVPVLLLGLATTGVVSAATGPAASDASGVPVATAPTSGAAADRSASSVSRGLTDARPALDEAELARTARTEAKAAQEKAAREKAAEAAAAKAAAAEKKAARAKAARAKAAREKAAQAKVLASALRSLDTRYTRVDLNVRAAADQDSRLLTVLDTRSKLSVTSVVRGGWRYVSYQGKGAWVKNQYLVERRPAAPKKKAAAAATSGGTSSAGTSSAACKGSSGVERGLTPDAVRVHRAICARFPSVTAYGGVRADSLPEHPSGRALDAMVSGSTGWEIARWVRANAKQLGVSQVLFAQKIWTVQRGGEGWRGFPDRGSATANHYDHVHVTVYGSSGG